MPNCAASHAHHLSARARMNVFAVAERLHQYRVARHVRQEAQLDLRVIRRDQLPARARHESGADLAPQRADATGGGRRRLSGP